MFALRKRSKHAGHCVLVSGPGRKAGCVVGWMCAGATWGEVAHRKRDLVFVSPFVWLIMLILTGAQYRRSE